MPDEINSEPSINCFVLRQADYKPGGWLLSDLHSHMSLYCDLSDARLKAWQELDSIDAYPYLRLVKESRFGDQRLMHARPIMAGDYTFGGNWLWSEDPGFPAAHPIQIHDALKP